MLITARDYAAQKGVHPRTIKLRLADGKLPGTKIVDANGVETWYVEIPDDQVGRIPQPPPSGSDPSADQGAAGNDQSPVGSDQGEAGSPWIFLKDLVEQLRGENQSLHRENLELAGRCGFLQNEVIQLRQQMESAHYQLNAAQERIALLEAPKLEAVASVQELDRKPWWRFW
jgi:hypothetical protein